MTDEKLDFISSNQYEIIQNHLLDAIKAAYKKGFYDGKIIANYLLSENQDGNI